MHPIIFRLSQVHARLDKEIRREMSHRWPDRLRITRLKKLRLAIKDRLHALGRRLGIGR
jgi:uncharacterized protein